MSSKGKRATYTSPVRSVRKIRNSPSGHSADKKSITIKKMKLGDPELSLPSILKRDNEDDIVIADAKLTEYNTLLREYNKTLQYYKKRLCSHDFTKQEYKKMTEMYTSVNKVYYDVYDVLYDKLERGASAMQERLTYEPHDEAARAAVKKMALLPRQDPIKRPEKPMNPSWSRWFREKMCLYSHTPDTLGKKHTKSKQRFKSPKV
jgi:hypothetical protein